MGIVYLVINKVNDKKYIGADKKNNPKYFGSGLLIKKALKKYGAKNFKKVILEECEEDILYEREKHWISFFNAKNSSDFYNLVDGGKGGDYLDNPIIFEKWNENRPDISKINLMRKNKTYEEIYGENTQKEKEKRRKALLGKKHSEERRKKISEGLKGHIPWNKGLTKDDVRVRKNYEKRKCVKCIKEYSLTTPNNENFLFVGKNNLKTFIIIENKKLGWGGKINIDKLISNGSDKNYIIKIKKIKNGKKFNNRTI